jgi:tetratricopeptide (TPR) repeat protein
MAVFGSAMAFGATHTAVLLVVLAPLAAATWLTWGGSEPMRPRPAATILFWTSALLLAFTALQALPLPIAWLRVLAPQAADAWDRALLPLREAGPAWATLTVDPIATRVEVVRGVAYLLTFVVAVRISARREGALFLEYALMATGLALAVAAWVHPALGADKVFGIYRPLRDPGARHMAPILNNNVLSGYLNIGLAITFGHVLRPRSAIPRSIAVALTAFLVATQFWVASRGGMLGMGVGIALVSWMSRAPGLGERSRLRGLGPAILLVAGLAMVVLVSSEQAWAELADTEVSKLQIGLRAVRLIPLFPVFGVGRGAFESVFPLVRDDVGHIVYTHPENIVAQWSTEWGPAVALAAAVALVVALRPRSALTRSPRAAGAWAALACVGLQNLVDFSSEYPGVVISLTVCAALVVGGTSGVESRRVADAWAKAPRALAFGGVLAAAAAACLGFSALGGELHEDRLALRRDALDPAVSAVAFHAEVRAAMLRHPAEPYLPFTGGLRALRTRDESVVGWVARTLERAKVYGPAHLLLARALAARSPAQSRLEYRLALEQAPEMGGYVAAEVLRQVGGYEDATDVAVQSHWRAQHIEQIVEGLASRLPATAARLDEDLAQLDAGSAPLARRRALEALADLDQKEAAPWCWDERRKCIDSALSMAADVKKLSPSRCDGFALYARAELEGGDAAGAVKELRAAVSKVTDRTTCLEELAQVAWKAKSESVLTETLDQLTHAGCADAKECIGNLLWVAGFEQMRGNPHRALAVLQRAHDRDVGNDDLLGRIAELAASVSLHAEALRAYEELARHHPGDARYTAAAAKEKEALLRDSVKL